MKKNFAKFFVSHKTIGYKPMTITLASGKKSYWYINSRVVSKTLALQEQTARYVVDFLKNKKILKGVDAVFGVPEGAAPLGMVITRFLIKEKIIKDAWYVFRKKPKEHGDSVNRFWVTGQAPKTVIVFEDVTTTAGSAISYIESLESAGVTVKALVSLVNREHAYLGKTVASAMKEKKIRYHTLTSAREVLPLVLADLSDTERHEAVKNLNQEYAHEYAPNRPPFVLK